MILGNFILLTKTRSICLTKNPVTIGFGDYFLYFYMEKKWGAQLPWPSFTSFT